MTHWGACPAGQHMRKQQQLGVKSAEYRQLINLNGRSHSTHMLSRCSSTSTAHPCKPVLLLQASSLNAADPSNTQKAEAKPVALVASGNLAPSKHLTRLSTWGWR